MKNKYFFILIVILSIFSCKEEGDMKEYVSFFNKKENGLSEKLVSTNQVINVSIKSREFMALMNIGPDALKMKKEQISEEIQNTEDFTYVFLKIDNEENLIVKDSIRKIEQINYFQNGILNDAILKNSNKEFKPSISTYISNNNIINSHTIILAFPIKFSDLNNKLSFSINKSKFLKENIQIQFPNFNKTNIPELSL